LPSLVAADNDLDDKMKDTERYDTIARIDTSNKLQNTESGVR